MSKCSTVTATGLNEVIRQLDELGKRGDKLAQQAATAELVTPWRTLGE